MLQNLAIWLAFWTLKLSQMQTYTQWKHLGSTLFHASTMQNH